MGDVLDILVVGEGLVPRERLEAELRRSGMAFSISCASCEQEMLSACRISPDVVVALDSDDTFDAVAMLSLCREMCPQAPVIVIANAVGEEVVVEALKSGVTDYIIADRLSRLGPALERAVREREAAAEKRAAEEAVRVAEAHFRGVFENAPIGICIRMHGYPMLANSEYLRIFDYSEPGQVPESFFDQLAPEFREVMLRMLGPGAKDPASGVYEGVALRPDGSRFPYEMRVADMMLATDEATVIFMADITERKESEL
ncbi:MAG: PAS domain S-box protein, partial [Coriobacteriia bacterium]|nr:PAS domain S-box protein [Coriobacteriia bacterium]